MQLEKKNMYETGKEKKKDNGSHTVKYTSHNRLKSKRCGLKNDIIYSKKEKQKNKITKNKEKKKKRNKAKQNKRSEGKKRKVLSTDVDGSISLQATFHIASIHGDQEANKKEQGCSKQKTSLKFEESAITFRIAHLELPNWEFTQLQPSLSHLYRSFENNGLEQCLPNQKDTKQGSLSPHGELAGVDRSSASRFVRSENVKNLHICKKDNKISIFSVLNIAFYGSPGASAIQ
uniref:Uncharacterized protein n=1 Tax=Romanomermis culicivorax TaxID=13658 RepID=A0A915IJ78_ROMCU